MRRRCHIWVVRVLLMFPLLAVASPASADPVSVSGGFLGAYWDGACAGFSAQGDGFRLCLSDGVLVNLPNGASGGGTSSDAATSLSREGRLTMTEAMLHVNPASPAAASLLSSVPILFDVSATIHPGTPASDFVTTVRIVGSITAYLTPARNRDFTSAGGAGASGIGMTPLENVTFDGDPAANPEPATLLLLGTGLAGIAFRARSRAKQ